MGAARIIIAEPLRVASELHAMGLDRLELREVLDAARWGRQNSTEYDPPGYAGWNQYGQGTRAVRMLLLESREGDKKWSMSNDHGLCRTISPNGSIAIVVSSGNEATGDPDRTPKTLNPKGIHSLKGLRVNLSQIELFGPESPPSADPWLWFLLINVRDGEAYGELSMPIDVDQDGRASEWQTRIMLAAEPGDHGDDGRREDDGDLDIDVTRRVG